MASTIEQARGTTQGSCLPVPLMTAGLPSEVTVFWIEDIVEVGLNATRKIISSPLVRPAWTPPLLFVIVLIKKKEKK